MTNALVLISPDEANFTSFLKPMLSAVTNTFVVTQEITYLSQLTAYCIKRGVTKVITTSPHFLWKLLEKDWPAGLRSRPSIKHYAGSVYDIPGIDGGEILFINPLKQLVTMPAARFITDRHISKITRPGKWNDPTEFSFTICNTVEKLNEAYQVLSSAFAIAVDIETIRTHASISCVGYTGGFVDSSGVIRTRSFVIQIGRASCRERV